MHRSTHGLRQLAVAAFAFAVAGCNVTDVPSSASAISVVSGSGQYTTVGTAAPNPLVVFVSDGTGTPFGGATVSWSVTAGGGTVADSTSTTDATGHATMSYTAGATPGTATIVATVSQAWTTTFTVYVESSANAIRIR